MKIQEITLDKFKNSWDLAGYRLGFKYYPPISPHDKDGFQIRVLLKRSLGLSRSSESYGYFYLDGTGLIAKSPHGHAGTYNLRVRITDIAVQMQELYKNQA